MATVDAAATVVASAIAAIPPTVMAFAAYRRAASTDRAVNHRKPTEPRLVEMVDDLRRDSAAAAAHRNELSDQLCHPEYGLEALGKRMSRHLAWHQENVELGLNENRKTP